VLFFPQHFEELLRSHKTVSEAFASYYLRTMAQNVKLEALPKADDEEEHTAKED
jgi:hypothetical protein